jgi:hypothetical protein
MLNITSEKKATFKNLKLEIINLMSNNIEVIEDEGFANLSNLETINLIKNNLKRFNPNAILSTPRLTRLDLGENFIEFLEKGSFSFIKADCAHKDVFLDLTAINLNVHLESNSIESLPEAIFDDHTFDMINIQHNPFKIFQSKIANFSFDCKNLDEKTLPTSTLTVKILMRNLCSSKIANFYFEKILMRKLCSLDWA